MRKRLIAESANRDDDNREQWLPIDSIAQVEYTSEDPQFPIESALTLGEGGWRAAEPGPQTLRLVFDTSTSVSRIRLQFIETEHHRSQTFVLRFSEDGQHYQEILRQSWNFSPAGSTVEVEDYRVDLPAVLVLELELDPDQEGRPIHASLAGWQVA